MPADSYRLAADPLSTRLEETSTGLAATTAAPLSVYNPYENDDPAAAIEAVKGARCADSLDALVRLRDFCEDSTAAVPADSHSSSSEYALPATEEECAWEERLWVQALLCSYTRWAGVGTGASYEAAVTLVRLCT